MESGNIYGKLEDNLARWQKLLMDIKLDNCSVISVYRKHYVYMDLVVCHLLTVLLSLLPTLFSILSSPSSLHTHPRTHAHTNVHPTSNPRRKSRKTIDNTETTKVFGPIEIFYGKVHILYSICCATRELKVKVETVTTRQSRRNRPYLHKDFLKNRRVK